MCMEYAECGDLRDKISRAQQQQKLIPEADIWEVCRATSQGLRFLHRQNIIHMDVKPQNILYTRDNTIKLADFGLAKPISCGHLSRGGTPWYTAPELIQ
jgi:serine/threonine protein kinase